MENFFLFCLIVTLLLNILMLARLFSHASIYNRYTGIIVMSTNIIPILLLVGLVDGRIDMYVDIAISYALLGFITSVILAKFLSGSRDSSAREDKDNEH